MTKNSALKKDARTHQRQHPGTRLADAMRAVSHSPGATPSSWASDDTPWIRHSNNAGRCYFCGNDTVVVSYGDLSEDRGRVEIYCESSDCDVREVEVIIVDDGTRATLNRSDVRIMAHFAPEVDRPEWADVGPGQDWAAGTPPYLRRGHKRAVCLFCGEWTCSLSRNDVADDNAVARHSK
jgi:hypothetical protein